MSFAGIDGRPDFKDLLHNFGGWENSEKEGLFLRKQFRTHVIMCGLTDLHLSHQTGKHRHILTQSVDELLEIADELTR
jgi:hypothetical protein